MNGVRQQEDVAISPPQDDLDLSDLEGEESQDDHAGDYSTRLEELMSDEEHSDGQHETGDDEDEDAGFFYTGADAEPVGTYRDQLRDVLGPDHELEEQDEREVENSLVHGVEEKERFESTMDDEARPTDMLSDRSPTTSSASPSGYLTPPRIVVSSTTDVPLKKARPFLHPNISRLRSATPQASRSSSAGSVGTLYSQPDLSAPPSHFSALSPASSASNLPHARSEDARTNTDDDREVFRWTQLRNISDLTYRSPKQKASSVLGAPSVGSPTVLAANGLVCLGTNTGKILVFDFKQNLKCVCHSPDNVVGPVTALALSYDHTYVASGHASGHIQLFDINSPKTPARFVPPTTLAAVASGRQEGHLVGSRIVSIGFVAGRHTAIVSADDSGLAFYHSLGKVLFVEASDTLRILGKYPDEDPRGGIDYPSESALNTQHPFRRRRMRKANTILSMSPLPLGTTAHSTDSYQLIALLTPIKLVVVGLKPSPKTWYRCHRNVEDELPSKSRFRGVLAWFPSVVPGQQVPTEQLNGKNASARTNGTIPMLVYGWGDVLNLIRVSESKFSQNVRNPKTGKTTRVETGRIVFEEVGKWTVRGDMFALQWLNPNQVLVLTSTTLEVYDIRTFKLVEHVLFDAWSLMSPILAHTTNGSISYPDAVTEVAHSVRVYKGKIFLLGQTEVLVGTLLTWADRILSFVESGDFLSAIELTRSYYVGDAPGNRNGLPDGRDEMREVVGDKMHELMVASAHYAFSEERMTDETHITPDGRGVDRTSLFEGLVVTCARACIALNDFEFLFEDLYSHYDYHGIARIFLLQLEPFVLDGKIHYVPPRITQKLVALHDENNRPDLAERLIWHIDPDCLDINQAITLCQNYQLYDALIYIYTRAMRDYVSPVVELLGLIRRVQQYRRTRAEASPSSKQFVSEDTIEPVVLNAYKIYPYLSDVLTGLTYPSEEPIPEDEALQAKNDVYTFIFFGRSSVWPIGEGGKLVLTSDEENGVEPTYPYARLLLRYDAEAFLHTLDLAFEDHYLNDETHGVSRLVMVKILVEILSTPGLPQSDATFINIFIARNIPKYPQFIQMTPSALHSILIGLAEDEDENTREDRQLAAEFLLSAYTPHESDRILHLFEHAGFYRILRRWHRQEGQWSPLFMTYLEDPDLRSSEIFTSVDEILSTASRFNKGVLPPEVLTTVTNSLDSLLDIDVSSTAALVDKRIPRLHEQVMQVLRGRTSHDRFVYLRYLIGSPRLFEDSEHLPYRDRTGPSPHIPAGMRLEYISLLGQSDPTAVIHELEYLPQDFLDWQEVVNSCEEHEIYDAVIWSLYWRGDDLNTALSKTEAFHELLSDNIARSLDTPEVERDLELDKYLSAMRSIQNAAVSACVQYSNAASHGEASTEDMWLKLLKSQIGCVHRVSLFCSKRIAKESKSDPLVTAQAQAEEQTMVSLRSLVQDTFTSLMSASSSRAVSFPRLFKRLVDSVANSRTAKGMMYTEFRSILTTMLESYRSNGDMLVITKHLIDRDVYTSVEEMTRERMRGWAPSRGMCSMCGAILAEGSPSPDTTIVVSRTGAIYHRTCLSLDNQTTTTNVN